VSGEICPGDWANAHASATAPTSHSQRRDSGAVTRSSG
jgi:hypothetical protein